MRGAQSAVDLSSITRSIDVENRRRANSLTGLNDPDVARSRSEISFNTNVARMAHLPDLDPLLRPRRAWSTGSPLQAPAEEDAEAANGMQPLTPLLGVLRPAAGGAPPPTPGWRNMRKWMRPNAERGAIFNLCSATLGAGALSLPYAFREAGVGTAIILLLVCAGLTAFSIRLLLLARKHTGLTTYEDMASTLYSRCFALLLEINMLLFCFGCAVGYIVALSDLVEPFVRFFPATSLLPCKDWITIGVWAVVLLPLSLVKEVSSLQCTSTLGIVALAVLVVFVFGHMVLHLFDTGVSFRGLVEQIDWFHYSSLGVLNALPIMLFAFSCQLNVYSIQSELEVPTMARMSRIMKGAIAICLSVYLTIGVGGYIEFQTTTKGNILLNYDPAAEPVMLIPFLGITLTVLMAFPMNIFPCRYTLNELVFHVLPEMYAETKRVRHSAGKHRAVADDVAAAAVHGELSRQAAARPAGSIAAALVEPLLLPHSIARQSSSDGRGGDVRSGAARGHVRTGSESSRRGSGSSAQRSRSRTKSSIESPPDTSALRGGVSAEEGWTTGSQESGSGSKGADPRSSATLTLQRKWRAFSGTQQEAPKPKRVQVSLFERFFDPTPTGVPALVRHVGSTLLITGSALFLAIVLPSIQVVFQLLGSSSSTLVCFLAPAFFALKVAHRGVARSDAVVVRAVKAPRCCGCRCSRAWLCGRGGAPAPSRAAQAVTAAGATHPSEGKRADAAQRSSVMLDVSQERHGSISSIASDGSLNGDAARPTGAGPADSSERARSRSSAAFAIGDELRMVTVQFERAAGQGFAVVDSDSLDHATPPLPMNALEYAMAWVLAIGGIVVAVVCTTQTVCSFLPPSAWVALCEQVLSHVGGGSVLGTSNCSRVVLGILEEN